MKKVSTSLRKIISLASFIILLSFTASAQTLTTDALDYPPGSTVTINGTGFQPNEAVTIQVTHNPTCCDDSIAPDHQPWFITADGSGAFTTTWHVPDSLDEVGANLIAKATGQASALYADAVFRDANRFAVASGNWNGAIWAATSNGVAGSAATPTNADAVSINTGVSVTVNVAAAANGLTVNGTLNLNNGTNNLTMGNNSTVIVSNGGAIVFNSTSVINGGGSGNNGISVTVNPGASLTTANAAGFATGNGNNPIGGSFAVEVGNKGGPVYDPAATYNFTGGATGSGFPTTVTGNVTIANGATVTTTNSIAVNSPGILTINGTLTPGATSQVFSGTGTLTGSGTVQVTLASATALTTQYSVATKTLTNLTVDYASAGAQSIAATPISGTNYGGLTLSGGFVVTKTLLGNVTVNGNLTIINGPTLDVSASNYAINIGGNWNDNYSFNARNGTVTFNGAGTQTITEPSNNFYNFTVNKPSGTITLSGSLRIDNTLTLTNGIINAAASGYPVIINSGGGYSGGSSSSYVSGVVERTFTSVGSLTFPIGKGGNYRPITINCTSITGASTFIAEQIEAAMNCSGNLPSGSVLLGNRYWTVSESATPPITFNITLDQTGLSTPVGTVYIEQCNVSTFQSETAATGTAPHYTATGYTANTSFNSFDFGLADKPCTAPSVTTQPSNQTVTYGSNASYAVAATGTATLTYQWQEKVGAGSFANITNGGVYSGATTATLTLTKPGVSMSTNQYQCVVTNNGCGTATSTAVTLTVNPKTITVTATAGQNKVYGTSNPIYTYSFSPALETGDAFSGALSRLAGENVGSYAYSIGTLSAGANYSLTLTAGTFAITQRPITITADAKNKTYGNADPALTYQITSGSLAFSDAFTGSLSRAAGENIGTYAITQGSVALSGNYSLTYVGANLTIAVRPITITADAKNKTYGNADPSLTYQITSGSIAFSDAFSGSLSRVVGENVGTYAVTQGTVALSSNYNLSYVGANLTIGLRSITITTDAKNKTYGNSDPALTYQITSGSLAFSDAFSGSLSRAAGEGVGTYAITQGAVALSSNYSLTYGGANLTIGVRAITITADAKNKTYGNADPAFTYQITSGSLAFSDAFSGSLSRVGGENVGSYAITQGTVSLNSNYNLTYSGANLTINQRSITITANANQSKIYGNNDPVLNAGVTSGSIAFSDVPTGTLTRVAGESVGSYAITKGSYTFGNNYNETFVGSNFNITQFAVSVTADAKTKVYGSVDPALTFVSSPAVGFVLPNGDAVSFSGALSRIAGENIGAYAINQGTVDNSNYSISYTGANLVITQLAVSVTADAKTKVYGSVDPALTFVSSPAVGFVLPNGDAVSFSGALSRVAGENIGSYAINQGTVDNSNYSISYTGANLSITQLAVSVTADAKTKVYGSVDPALTFVSSPAVGFVLPNGDAVSFSGALSRIAGENIGAYAINQGSVDNSNYSISYVGANLTITQLAVSVTADAKTKVYGSVDPALTFVSSPAVGFVLPNGDAVSFSGALSRIAGENIGAYAINQGTVDNSNYSISYTGANLSITQLAVSVTADAKTKVYGSVDPALTFVSSPAVGFVLPNGDAVSFSGALSRIAGENIGAYAINQGTVDNSNYSISYTGANLSITQLAVSVTADAKTKVYGSVDPALTFVSSPAVGFVLPNGDAVSFSGALSRVAGENIGSYAINQGTVDNSNYSISYTGANLSITQLAVSVTADAKTKVYGSVDPALTFVSSPAVGFVLPNGDAVSFSGALSRIAGENIGAYAINQGSVDNSNYSISYVGANLTITQLAVSVTADAKTKVYGSVDPALTFVSSPAVGFVLPNGDAVSFSGALSRIAGENIGAYAINQGSVDNSNYSISYVGANLNITQLAVSVTADAKTKVYGSVDPALTFVSSPAVGTVLPNGDVIGFSGSLSRVSGENIGAYTINQGSVDNSNYSISYTGANLSITQLAVSVTADAKTKVYGSVDPALTFVSSPAVGFVLPNGDAVSFSGALSRIAGENIGAYAINQGTVDNSNYSISYTGANLSITQLAVSVTADAKTKVYGSVDPALTFVSSPAVGFVLPNGDAVSFSGALSRIAGENIGAYAINQGTVDNSNYSISYTGANLSITQLAVSVTADAKTKVYGSVDPALTFVSSPAVGFVLPNGDAVSFSGALSRIAGENIGAYAINQGTVDNSNYSISYTGANLSITQLAVSVTADAKTKVYGSVDPALTFVSSPAVGFVLPNGDAVSFSGALSRVAGENIGSYAINQGTVDNSNYSISYTGANLSITQLAVSVTADAKTKVYGSVDPALTFVSSPAVGFVLPNGDAVSFSGALSRIAGENIGAYAINQGSVDNSNYSISYTGANLVITQLAVSVTADTKTKVYGSVDPALTFVSSPAVGFVLPNGDAVSFSGALSRIAGENIGAYAINQGSVDNSNYSISYVGANLTITQLAVSVTADAKTKVYGSVDPALTFVSSPAVGFVLPNGDAVSFSGALSRIAGENIGAYAINQGSVDNSNYSISYVGANLNITQLAVSVTADAKTKVYGSVDPALTFVSSPAVGTVLPNGDVIGFSGSLSRVSGENIGAYTINQGSVDNSNYSISYTGANLSITQLAVSVTADAKTKVYGSVDPALTFVSSPAVGFVLPNGDAVSFSGALSRIAGENIGAYAINQGTVDNSNYSISYTGANLSITQLAVSVTADAKTKVYGSVDPALTFVSSPAVGFVLPNGDAVSFSGALSRIAGENIGAYAINQGTVDNSNYSISYTGANLSITQLAVSVTADAKTKVYGSVDPALTFVSSPAVGFVLPNGDAVSFSGALSRIAGENIGAYAINQGTVDNSNYSISYTGANLSITQLAVSVTADAKTKVYGSVDPALTFVSSPAVGFVLPNGDAVSFSGALSRIAGENIGAYAINQGSVDNSNYSISYTGANLVITQLAVSVTADTKTKVYGSVDPALTFVSSPAVGFVLPNGDAVSFSGALSRIAGENIGAYAINQGSVDNSNYSISYTGANLVITQLAVSVTADTKTKVYGSVDPALTFVSSPAVGFVLPNGDAVSFSGALSRIAGENIGAYAINQGTVDNSNYSISYTGANLSITQLAVSVTADAKTKVYGSVDPALTFVSSPAVGFVLPNGDAVSFSGALSRVAGENIGSYAINQGSVDNSNYSISYTGANLSITQLAVSVTADAKTKVYGSVDPALTFVSSPAVGFVLPNGDAVSFSGALSRIAGENIGAYAINQGSVDNSNYSISYVGANLTITQLAVSVTADAKTKVYGSVDPALTFVSSPAVGFVLPNGDAVSFSGALSRIAGENIGAYAINQGTVDNSNYSISYTGANLSITQLAVSVTADAKTKVYGSVDPALTFVSSPAVGFVLPNGDAVSFSGALSRVAGENIGSYAINQGSVDNSNYSISYTGANLSITQLAVSVTADAKTKVYGSVDPALTFVSSPAVGFVLPNGDAVSFSGALSRVAGENIGSYAINQGSVDNSNYSISYTGANLSITQLAVSVTADAKTKVYGSVDPALTFVSSPAVGFVLPNGDAVSFSGALSRIAGENIGAYAINQGTVDNSNYSISYTGANLSITQLAVSVTADAKTKVYGSVDPALTFVSSPAVGFVLPNGDAVSFSGALSRIAGENIGAYAINQGTVDNSNYSISYTGANLSITQLAVSVTADAKTKVYGSVDPALTFVSSPAVGFVLPNGDAVSFSGALSRIAGENIGAYAINQGSVDNSNYSISYTGANLVITQLAVSVTADTKTKVYGSVDPALTFVSSPAVGFVLPNGDAVSFSGALSRIAGENIGAYAINQGTVDNSNYSISYTGANLSIIQLAVSVTADAKTKVYGSVDPALTFVSSPAVGFVLPNGDAVSFSGALSRVAGENIGAYAINQNFVANSNYTISYTGANLIITPLAVCQSIDVNLNSTGAASITASQVDNGTINEGGIASLNVAPNSFNCSNLGPNIVTLTATDNLGNSSTCTTTVTVHDVTAPVLSGVPAAANANCSSIPAAGTPTATDNCDSHPVISLSEGSTQNADASVIGHYSYTITRTWIATDASGNHSSQFQVITVSDGTSPVLSGVPANTNASCSSIPTAASPSATDNCDPHPAVSLSEVSTQNADAGVIGHYNYTITRTWTATDVSGNHSSQSQIITVSDATAPAFACPASQTLVLNANCSATLPDYRSLANATDNCADVAHITKTQSPAPGTVVNGVGTTSVTITATDVALNSYSRSFNVNRVDNTPPAITCPANITAGECNVVNFSVTATDNCSGNISIVSSQTSGHTFPVGTTTVSSTATDASGNHSSCSFNINVIAKPANITAGYNTGACQATTLSLTASATSSVALSYAWTGPGGFLSAIQNPTRANATPAMSGLYTVVVTDVYGCTASASVNVSINPLPGAPVVSGGASPVMGSVLRGGTYNFHADIQYATSYTWTYSGTGVTVSGTNTSDLAIAFACNATNGILSIRGTNSCGNGPLASLSITTNAGSIIYIYTAKLTTGSGNHPVTQKTAIMPVDVPGSKLGFKVWRSNQIGITAKRKNFDNIWHESCVGVTPSNHCNYNPASNVTASASVTGPVLTTYGGGPAYKYTMVVPAGYRYLVIAKETADPTSCDPFDVGQCYVYPGKRTINTHGHYDQCDEDDDGDDDGDTDGNFTSCFTKSMYLQVIEDAQGKVRPANTDAIPGSMLLIASPNYIEFTDTISLLPIVYESADGYWEESVTATPPEGFYSVPGDAVQTDVSTSNISTVQFTLVDTGSTWTATELTTHLKHNGREITHTVTPGMVNHKGPKDILCQNYPNPFNGSTTILFTLPKDGHATLDIFNPLGQKVQTLFDDYAKAGTMYKVQFDGSNMAEGMYFYNIRSKGINVSRKMQLMK